MNYSELLQLAKGWSNFVSNRINICRLPKNYDTVLIGYGNSMAGNKRLREEKMKLDLLLQNCKSNIVELVDKDNVYSRLHTIHPLFAGQRFTGQWKFRKYIIETVEE